jgi:hypothetical protein
LIALSSEYATGNILVIQRIQERETTVNGFERWLDEMLFPATALRAAYALFSFNMARIFMFDPSASSRR